MANNIPARKSEIIAGVVQGTQVGNKEDGKKAAKQLDGTLAKTYALIKQAKVASSTLTMVNNFEPKDRKFLAEQVNALNKIHKKLAQVTNNLKEEARVRLSTAPKPAAPEQVQPTVRRPGKS